MALIEVAPEVFEDFERILTNLASLEADTAVGRIQEIVDAIQILATSPLIGRPTKARLRELVIGRGAHGYVALCRYVVAIDTVFLLIAFQWSREPKRDAGSRSG